MEVMLNVRLVKGELVEASNRCHHGDNEICADESRRFQVEVEASRLFPSMSRQGSEGISPGCWHRQKIKIAESLFSDANRNTTNNVPP
jgi:hypothetical protein